MGFWDKAKDAAKKAAEKAQEGATKAANVARDQYYREDSAFNKAAAKTGELKDKALGAIDDLDSAEAHDRGVEDAKRYQERVQEEKLAGTPGEMAREDADEEAPPEGPRFPNSLGLPDDDVYHKVVETMFPDFSGQNGKKRWALCEIARYEKRIVNLNRSIGSAYIETVRQLAENDNDYRTVLQAAGAWDEPEIKRAYRYWLDDSYDDAFYADDDPSRSKGERLLGWLVLSKCGDALVQAFSDAGLEDPFGLAHSLGKARTLVDARENVAMKHFRVRRSKLESEFLVQRGLNADMSFVWLDSDGDSDGDGGGSTLLGGAGLTEL